MTLPRPVARMGGMLSDQCEPEYIAFDDVAEIYEQTRRIPDAPLEALARLLRDDLGTEALLLDAGCGTGRILRRLAAAGVRVIGADVSNSMLRRAQGDSPLLRCDLRQLAVRSGAVRGVLFMHVLHLVRDWHRVIAEARRTLAAGGAIYVVSESPRRLPAMDLLYASLRAHGAVRSHIGARTPHDILDYLRSTGAHLTQLQSPSLTWGLERSPAETLDLARRRVYSDSWRVPQDLYDAAIYHAETLLRAAYADMERPETCEMSITVWRAKWEQER